MDLCPVCNEDMFIAIAELKDDKLICCHCAEDQRFIIQECPECKKEILNIIKMIHKGVFICDYCGYKMAKNINSVRTKKAVYISTGELNQGIVKFVDELEVVAFFVEKTKRVEVINYSDILQCDIVENGVTDITTSSGVGRAIVGGIIAGGVGAVVGASTRGSKTREIINKLSLQIILKNSKTPLYTYDILQKPVDKDTFLYKDAREIISRIFAHLSVVIEGNKTRKTENSTINIENTDVLMLIAKMDELWKAGVLTEEEFVMKKKELLARL